MNLYSIETLNTAREYHEQSSVANSWDLTFEEIAEAYYKGQHSDESFIWNMMERSIYNDLADQDNMSIMKSYYPEKYKEWLSFQEDPHWDLDKQEFGVLN